MAPRYQIAAFMTQFAAFLGNDPIAVFKRAGLPAEAVHDPDLKVDAKTFFALWDATMAEADNPSAVLDLAKAYAHGPFIPAIFAFSCAETVAKGLGRLALYKPLIGPLAFDVTRPDRRLRLTMRSSEPGRAMPGSLGLFEALYITESARSFTGVQITPMSIILPNDQPYAKEAQDHLGTRISGGDKIELTFSAHDADLPLLTRSASLWETLEPKFKSQLETQEGTATLSGQIKQAFAEALPGGAHTVDDMARRLNLSKRSLQRRLSEEGTNFQLLLNETRQEMSERYLKDSALSVPEISYLLGFRDTSSFFRAFQGWTGTTPGDFRSSDHLDLAGQMH